HAEAVTKYEKEFEEYLAHFRKKKDGDKKDAAPSEAKEEPKPAGTEEPAPAAPTEGRRGRRRPPRDGISDAVATAPTAVDALLALFAQEHGDSAQEPEKQDPKPQDKPADEKPAEKKPEAKDEAPKRP